MAITQDKFDTLVKKLENFSQHHPESYRLRVALFAVLGYVYIFLVIAGLLTLVGLIVLLVIYSRHINAFQAKLIISILITPLITVCVIVRSLWVSFPPPQGLRLSRNQVPHLFTLLDELTTQLQTPQFHNILLNREFNAAVLQVPRLGIFGWQENYLLLGLPLMQSLSLEQFKAVLAHELGHLSGNHSYFAAWIYRVRKTWMQIYERLQRVQPNGASILFNRFLKWYWPAFNAYSFILARMNEYEADRCAAQLAGAQNTAEALINIEIKACFLESSFWSDIHKHIEHQADPPDNTYSSMLIALRSPIAEEKSNQWLEKALAQKTNNQDTHPCLFERLKSLGYLTAQTQKLPQSVTIQTSAAEHLLGNTIQEFAAQFDRDWFEALSTPWRQRYGYLQKTQNKLQVLEQKARIQILAKEEVWERAYYTLELRGSETALPLLQQVVTTQPDRAAANYILGQILLEKDDAAGIDYIEMAIALKIDWVIKGCELVYNFYCQRGDTEAAQKYSDRAKQHHQLLLKAQQERFRVSYHDKFKPHTLEASEISELKQQLAVYLQVKEAYLVEKVVTHLPEKRFFVLGIIRQRSLLESEDAAKKLTDLLFAKLDFPIQGCMITVLNNRNSNNYRKKICRIEGALIFRR